MFWVSVWGHEFVDACGWSCCNVCIDCYRVVNKSMNRMYKNMNLWAGLQKPDPDPKIRPRTPKSGPGPPKPGTPKKHEKTRFWGKIPMEVSNEIRRFWKNAKNQGFTGVFRFLALFDVFWRFFTFFTFFDALAFSLIFFACLAQQEGSERDQRSIDECYEIIVEGSIHRTSCLDLTETWPKEGPQNMGP